MSYKRFTSRMKLSDVLHSNYYLLPIVHRFDIHFGIGDKSIAEICRENSIDADFFVEILNVYHDEFYFPEQTLRRSDVRLIIEYLRKTHRYYIDYLLPEVEKLITALTRSGGRKNKGIVLVGKLYKDYKEEFLKHIEKEETGVFPYALRIAEQYQLKKVSATKSSGEASSIRQFKSEHSMMDEKLFDVKNILIKYIEPPFNVHLCNTLIFELHRLERDVQDHSRIEDRILFAVIEQMESALKGKRK